MAFILILVLLELLGLVALVELVELNISEVAWAWGFRAIKFSADVIFLLVVYFALKRYIFNPEEKPEVNKLKYFSFAILGGLIMVMIQPYITYAFSFLPGFEVFKDYKFQAVIFKSTDVFYIVSTTVLAPITEELFFRGFLLKGLLRRYKLPIALIFSSVIFGFWHFNFIDPNILYAKHIFVTFIGGLAMGYIYIRSQKLIYPIVFHMTWNVLAVIGDYIDLSFI